MRSTKDASSACFTYPSLLRRSFPLVRYGDGIRRPVGTEGEYRGRIPLRQGGKCAAASSTAWPSTPRSPPNSAPAALAGPRIVRATRWFRDQGLALRRVLTDSGKRSRPRAFRHVVQLLGLTHARTRPYRPQTNGECERWIRTALGECLYLKVFSSSTKRRRPLERFVPWYKEARPHLGLGGRTPRQRLREKLAA